MKRVGIFAGTFDPVHEGHIAFAQATAKKFDLEKVVLLAERKPRDKTNVTAFEHRLEMLKLVTRKYPNLKPLELDDSQFSIEQTLPKLQKIFPGAQLALLFGSDVAQNLDKWPGLPMLAKNADLIIGLRQKDSVAKLKEKLANLDPNLNVSFIKSKWSLVTATAARQSPEGKIDPAVQIYIKRHKLYNFS